MEVLLFRRIRRRRARIQILRLRLRDQSNPFDCTTEAEFVKLFRLRKDICHDFIHILSPFITDRVGQTYHSLPFQIRILSALRFLATGSYQRAIGQDFFIAMSQTSISRCLEEFCNALNVHIAKEIIKFPNDAEQRETKIKFFQKFGFPKVIGLIDGSHILIKSPPKEIEQVYYAVRKSAHSKNVMFVFDFDYKILSINARYGGSAHDSFVFNNSRLRMKLEDDYASGNRNFVILGDSGYGLQPWLMTPILRPMNVMEERYNVAHKKARSLVERGIGILKSRFRCICRQRILMYLPPKAGSIINACAILHNIMIMKGYPLPPEDEIMEATDEFDSEPNDDQVEPETGNQIRNEIVTNYFT